MITGELWNVDIWFFDKDKIAAAEGYCDSIVQRTAPEQKQQIVAIKEELIRRGLYSFETYRSIAIIPKIIMFIRFLLCYWLFDLMIP